MAQLAGINKEEVNKLDYVVTNGSRRKCSDEVTRDWVDWSGVSISAEEKNFSQKAPQLNTRAPLTVCQIYETKNHSEGYPSIINQSYSRGSTCIKKQRPTKRR